MTKENNNEETIFTPIAKSVIETVEATQNVKNFLCKFADYSIKTGSKYAVNTYENPETQVIKQRVIDTYNSSPVVSIAFTTLLPIVLFGKSKNIRAVPLALVGLGASLKHFYPEQISDYAKISVDHYNRFRENFNNNNENNDH